MKTTDNEGWSSECPTTPGDHWFKSDEQPQVQATVALRDGKLCVWFEGEGGMPIRLVHIAEENPQWRPLRKSETPLTDAAEYPASTFANAPSDVKVVNSDLARMLETKLDEAESELAIARNRIKELAEEGTKAALHALELGVTAGNSVLERDAWKAVAERLAVNIICLCAITQDGRKLYPTRLCRRCQALAELERLRKG